MHVITDRLEDLSDLLRSVSGRDAAEAESHEARSVRVPEPRADLGIKVLTRDSR